MVIFNPQLQEPNPPGWGNDSRPISDIAADKSKALTIAAASDVLESGVKVAETTQQDIIKEKTRAGVEALRDATTIAYEQTRSALIQGQQPPAAAANVAGLTLLQKTAGSVPEPLQAGLDRAEDLALARSQGTLRANDTLYTGALNALAKQLRAEYPGHKDFIDEQIARISGKNPANAYMDNLLTDIARVATGTDSIEKKIVAKAFDNYGDPAVFKALKAYQMKLPDSLDKLATATNLAEQEKLKHTQTMQSAQEQEAAGKIDTGLARSQAQQSAQSTIFRNFNGLLATGGMSAKVISDAINDYRATGGTGPIDPSKWESYASLLEADRDNVLNTIKQNFNQYGISRRLASGGDLEAENKIISNEMQFYDRAIAAIRNEKYGTFFELQRRAKGIQDNANYQAMSDPNIGPFLARSAIIQEKAGPNWTNLIDRTMLTKGYLGPMANFLNSATQGAGVPEDPRVGNVGKSLTNDIIRAKKAAADGVKFDPRLYQDLVQNVDLIEEANKMGKPEVAKEIVKYMFDPTRNGEFVKQWSRDFKDSNGVTHRGYYAYYDMLTQPKVADSIRKLGDRDAWNMYRNWQETNFRQLFGNEVQELGKLGESSYFPSTIHWNSDTNQMNVVFSRKAKDLSEQTRMDSYVESINNLNKGLRNLAYTYKTEGTEPNEGIFTMLQQLGYVPNSKLVGESLPENVVKAIAASQFTPTQEERMKSSFDKLSK